MAVLQVGSAVLECEAAASDGNFGTLKLPRLTPNTPSAWLPRNIAEGLEEPLSLDTHDSAAHPWTCTDLGSSDDVIVSSTSPASLQPQTNCVDTDTGLPDNVATQGFITGDGGVPGRLDADTTAGCGSNASSPNSRWATGITAPGPGHPEYSINDDLLTCFMVDADKPLSDITVESYTDPPALSQDIYYSPRFFYMPVLGVDPSSGGSNRYSIIEFRAGFITDQPLYATRSGRQTGTTTHNGIAVSSGKISTVKVVFFNTDALPPPPEDAPDFAYMGSGPRLLKLVD
jgi:hypothetical protein